MNPSVRDNARRADECVLRPLSPTGGEGRASGYSDARCAGIRSAFAVVCACVITTLTPAGIARGVQPQGAIVAWGRNYEGQNNVPAPNTGFIAIAAGIAHSLGLKADGSVVVWGHQQMTNVPAPNADFIAIAAGGYYTLGLKADGSIVGWGINTFGQTDVPAPNADFISIAAGYLHCLGLKADGSIVAWGYNYSGQTNVPAPNADFIAVAAGTDHSLGIKGIGVTGACCMPDPTDTCQDIAPSTCAGLGGIARGPGSQCATSICGIQACCVPKLHDSFRCQNHAYFDCLVHLGVPKGDVESLCNFQPSGDLDGDFVVDLCDNCPDIANEDQADCDSDGIGDACAIANCTGDPACGDCNSNLIPDGCELDCNFNGITDACDIATGTSADCDRNAVPDECDIVACTGGPACSDCNGNSIPDGCEPDCNFNGIADECDIRDGNSHDANANGIPDECEDGACCDLLTGACTEDVLESACSGTQQAWTEGTACVDVVCDAVTGACCDHDPFGACTDGVTRAACDCLTCEWVKLGSCSELDCLHTPIPTVSEWGLVVLSLLLMTGAKLAFRRSNPLDPLRP